jgi:hypothetical protein
MTVFADRKPGFGAKTARGKRPKRAPDAPGRLSRPAGAGTGARRPWEGTKRPNRYPHGMQCETNGREAES